MTAESHLDRRAVIGRHHVVDPPLLDALALGNGECCFGIDATGLQTFAGNTMAHWAKHSAPLPAGLTSDDIPATGTFDTGAIIGPMRSPTRSSPLGRWMVQNPHPINLGRFRLIDQAGNALTPDQLRHATRTLDLWQGCHTARFEWAGQPVEVLTLALPDEDGLAVRIVSPLLGSGELAVELDFPHAVPGRWKQDARLGDFSPQAHGQHTTRMTVAGACVDFQRQIDAARYAGRWRLLEGCGRFTPEPAAHRIRLTADRGDVLGFVCVFANQEPGAVAHQNFQQVKVSVADAWESFWRSGGAIDLSQSTDPRWHELERRVVLSQYLMRTNNAGSLPPAEFALLANDPWQGEFHMEMLFWHLAHYALWGRWELAEKALQVYPRFLPIARQRAAQLGYRGAKWGKQESPEGVMTPWLGNLQLNWQQPHPILFAELEYRLRPTAETLEKWRDVIHATAEFMASFPVRDAAGVYHLQHVMTANENGTCHDPSFESAYWRWGLDAAQRWRSRLGLPPEAEWQRVRDNLAPLSTKVDPKLNKPVYDWCAQWVEHRHPGTFDPRAGHPDVIGAFAFIPFVAGVDRAIAASTVESVRDWKMGWGWDYPWYAMAAARAGRPDLALDALMDPAPNNAYSQRGICNDWYFPGNGGLLYAVAMLAAGWDDCPPHAAPGFPTNGRWQLKHEGLHRAL